MLREIGRHSGLFSSPLFGAMPHCPLCTFGLRADNDIAALPTGWKVTVDNVTCRADAGR